MTHPRNAPPHGTSAGADAEKAAFLRDLRALRDHAGLGPRDLAARAHFPEHTLTTAEAGPALPSLPVLQAYVRGCGAGEAEWEDRWRRLNQDSAPGGSDLPTRAPATARAPARVMPFPAAEAEQDAIGFGLARVARGLVPINPDPPRPGLGDAGLGGSAATDSPAAAGWFDPPAKAASSPPMFAPSSASSSPPPPSPAPAAPEAEREAPTMQYPTLSGHEAPQSYREKYATPAYQPPTYEPAEEFRAPAPPEEFRTPVPEPPSTPPPAPPGPSATFAGLSTPPPAPPAAPAAPGPARPAAGAAPSAPRGSSAVGSSAAASSPGMPKAHAAPASPWRHTAGWVVVAVIALLVIGAVLWLLIGP